MSDVEVMNQRVVPLAVLAVTLGALASCQSGTPLNPPDDKAEQASVVLNNCTGSETPAHVLPPFVRPPDDGVVFDSLLEGAAYATESNSDWTGVASGNFCGGAEKELVLMKNMHSYFSVMRGPTPYAVGSGDLNSSDAHPWRAVAAGNLDGGAYDLIAAVRHVTATGVPDLVVGRVDPSSCFLTTVVASTTVGNPSNSDWVGAAIGNFDGTGKKIALLKTAHANLVLLQLASGNTLNVTYSSDLDSNASMPWKAVAAGDLDGDGIDELVVARQVSDGASATILVYKWVGSGFQLAATQTFGNTGNSSWAGLAVGDFNGDGHNAIVVTKNAHSNFAVFDLPPNTSSLRELTSGDLDSVPGQDWRGLTATDWLTGDQGAAELVAVRKAVIPYVVDLFVYGNPFHRAARDSGLAGARAEYDQHTGVSWETFVGELQNTHTNTVDWIVNAHADPITNPGADNYTQLVAFLEATKNTCIDGRQLRVWVTLPPLPPPGQLATVNLDFCAWPRDSQITPWNELDYFTARGDTTDAARCTDYVAWASLLGRLAQDYPHLVTVGIDDFGNHPEYYTVNLPEMESQLRSQAPWVNFVPTVYYHTFANNSWPDLSRMLDTVLFFFRNEKAGLCLSTPCGENSIPNMPGELDVISAALPSLRKALLGMYFVTLFSDPPQTPSVVYTYNLTQLALSLPQLEGVTAYSMQGDPGFTCNDFNYLSSSFCVLWKLYGADGHCTPGQVQACGDCGTQTCTSSSTWGACSGQGVCVPGTTNQTACGTLCGTRVDTCSASCQWVTGTCGNEGVCRTGQSRSCCPCAFGQACNTMGEEFCDNSCGWSSCEGYACGSHSPQ